MSEKKSLDARIDKIVKSSFVSKENTQELINKAQSSSELSSYFKLLADNPEHKRLLFLHRFDLFGIEDEMQIPYLYLCDLPKKFGEVTEGEPKSLQQVVSYELELANGGKNILNNVFGIDEKKWEIFSEDLKDVIAYFAILFIRKNPNIRALVNAKQFDYRIMKDVLKNYDNTVDLDMFADGFEEGFEKIRDEIDPIVLSKIERLVIQIVSGTMKNYEKFIETTPRMFPNYFLSFHLSSRVWLNNLLKRSRLSFKEYLHVLDDLYRYRLIENKSTIFWCENCSIENPSFDQHHGRIAPSKICGNKCLICKKSQSYSSIFSINDVLKDAILSKDGILPVYFGWLLKREDAKYEIGRFSGDYENDFILNESVLIESKMFKSEKDPIAIRSELDGSLSMIKKHIEQLHSDGIRIKRIYLLWNRNSYEKDHQRKLKPKYNELFEKYGFKIICPEEIEDILQNEII